MILQSVTYPIPQAAPPPVPPCQSALLYAGQGFDLFLSGYMDAAFATCPEGWVHDNCTVADFAPETVQRMERDCARFLDNNEAYLTSAFSNDCRYTLEQAGGDLWFSRGRFVGKGFSARLTDDAGDLLHEQAQRLSILEVVTDPAHDGLFLKRTDLP